MLCEVINVQLETGDISNVYRSYIATLDGNVDDILDKKKNQQTQKQGLSNITLRLCGQFRTKFPGFRDTCLYKILFLDSAHCNEVN